MLIKRSPNGIDLPFSSEITPRELYESRRSFMKQIALGAVGSAALLEMANREAFAQGTNPKLAAKLNPAYSALDKQTPYHRGEPMRVKPTKAETSRRRSARTMRDSHGHRRDFGVTSRSWRSGPLRAGSGSVNTRHSGSLMSFSSVELPAACRTIAARMSSSAWVASGPSRPCFRM